MMALTKDFREYIQGQVTQDPKFAEALFIEAVQMMLNGEFEIGRTVLRNYINATVGFEKLAVATGTPSKSLHRMFGPGGNPQAANLFRVIGTLQHLAGQQISLTRSRRRLSSETKLNEHSAHSAIHQ